MGDSFFAYLHRLESLAFFSGYPLIYAIVFFIAGSQPSKTKLKGQLFFLLPFSYALVGTLYLGLQLKNLYPDYSMENLKQVMQQPFLVGWGLLSLLFWIPAIAKKRVLSLLHSLVFFFFIVQDLFFPIPAFANDEHIVRNDMKLYTESLLLNTATLIAVTIVYFLIKKLKADKSFPLHKN
ncbi:MAG TPA: hypothetical protein VIZ28_07600 [Chitinophagaceae bacterium]